MGRGVSGLLFFRSTLTLFFSVPSLSPLPPSSPPLPLLPSPLPPPHLQLLELVLQVVTLYYGGHLVIYGEMTGGELVSLLLYQVSLTAALDVSACASQYSSLSERNDSCLGIWPHTKLAQQVVFLLPCGLFTRLLPPPMWPGCKATASSHMAWMQGYCLLPCGLDTRLLPPPMCATVPINLTRQCNGKRNKKKQHEAAAQKGIKKN